MYAPQAGCCRGATAGLRTLSFFLKFGPGVAQGCCAVKDRALCGAVFILAKVAKALELHFPAHGKFCKGRLKQALNNRKRLGIDIVQKGLTFRSRIGVLR